MGQNFKEGIWIFIPPLPSPRPQLSNTSSIIGYKCIYIHRKAHAARWLCITLNPEIIASHRGLIPVVCTSQSVLAWLIYALPCSKSRENCIPRCVSLFVRHRDRQKSKTSSTYFFRLSVRASSLLFLFGLNGFICFRLTSTVNSDV